MSDHDPTAYGRSVADEYDALYAELTDTEAVATVLAELAGDGAALEFGIGTGRLGIALAQRGVKVAGIEGSEDMAELLRAKPEAEGIEVAVGDFADTKVAGDFAVVFIAFNTIFALPTQDAQISCFENAADHLRPGGCFVVEAVVLRPDQLDGRRQVHPRTVSADGVELQISQYDPVEQRMERTLVHITRSGNRFVPVRDRYAWPAELDLMARIAGLRKRERWGGWHHEPFVTSSQHVSVYGRQA